MIVVNKLELLRWVIAHPQYLYLIRVDRKAVKEAIAHERRDK